MQRRVFGYFRRNAFADCRREAAGERVQRVLQHAHAPGEPSASREKPRHKRHSGHALACFRRVTKHRSSEQIQMIDFVRILRCVVCCDDCPEGMGDEGDVRGRPFAYERAPERGNVILERVLAVRPGRTTEAERVDEEERVLAGHCLEVCRLPVPCRSHEPCQQHHRRAGSRALHVKRFTKVATFCSRVSDLHRRASQQRQRHSSDCSSDGKPFRAKELHRCSSRLRSRRHPGANRPVTDGDTERADWPRRE